MAAEQNSRPPRGAAAMLTELCEARAIYRPSWRSHRLFLEAHPVWGLCASFDASPSGAFIPHSLFSTGMRDNKLERPKRNIRTLSDLHPLPPNLLSEINLQPPFQLETASSSESKQWRGGAGAEIRALEPRRWT